MWCLSNPYPGYDNRLDLLKKLKHFNPINSLRIQRRFQNISDVNVPIENLKKYQLTKELYRKRILRNRKKIEEKLQHSKALSMNNEMNNKNLNQFIIKKQNLSIENLNKDLSINFEKKNSDYSTPNKQNFFINSNYGKNRDYNNMNNKGRKELILLRTNNELDNLRKLKRIKVK